MQAATQRKRKANSLIGSIVIVVGLIMIIVGIYSYLLSPPPPEYISLHQPTAKSDSVIEAVSTAQPSAAPVEELIIETAETSPLIAIQEVEPAVELPSLDDSDSVVLASAEQLSSPLQDAQLLVSQEMIRNFVVFVDNFSRGELVSKFSPLARPGESFSIVKVNQEMFLNTESYNRYNIYTDIISAIDIEFSINQYRTLKPLFDQAYREIGYPDESFDNRLSAAITLVLNTPIIREPIALLAPSAMYKFSDPELEALPDAQKLVIRMGPDNILKLSAKLQKIQNALEAF